MATKISRNFDFLAAVHFEGMFLINEYDLILSMDVQTDSIIDQNIAMDRLKYFTEEVLTNVVFVHDAETRAIEKFQAAGIKVCTLPEEPYDQIITLLLLHKFNAICENRLVITNIQLDSQLSDGVGFIYDYEDLFLEHPYKNGWWVENSTSITDRKESNKKEKVVKLVKKADWANLHLDFKSKDDTQSDIPFKPDND